MVYCADMGKRVRWLVQALVFVVVLAAGAWVRLAHLGAPMPMPDEAPELLAAATRAEAMARVHWPEGVMAQVTPFHEAAACCAMFLGQHEGPGGARSYRLFVFVLSALFLIGIPALGLRRRGGVFETADGPLWAMAFAAAAPALVWHGQMFGPFAGQAFAFLAMLVAARAYAQWPGYCAAAVVGACVAVGVAVDADVLWVLVALLPALLVGVGWTRLCLYWRTSHVLMAVAVAVALCAGLAELGMWGGAPDLPRLPGAPTDWVREPAWRAVWLCAGGLGALAWVGLTVWGGWKASRRWARLFSVAFPCCFVGSLFFDRGGAFAVPLAALSPLMLGLAVSTVPSPWVRGVLGMAAAAFLTAWTTWALAVAWRDVPAREAQREAARTLLAISAETPERQGVRLRVGTDDPRMCAAAVWPLRTSARHVAYGAVTVCDDADIVLVEEGRLAGLPPGVWRLVRPGVIALGEGRSFRALAPEP